MRKFFIIFILIYIIGNISFAQDYPSVSEISYEGKYIKPDMVIDLRDESYINIKIEFNKIVYFNNEVSLKEIIKVFPKHLDYNPNLNYEDSYGIEKICLSISNIQSSEKIEVKLLSKYITDNNGLHLDGEYKNIPSDFSRTFYIFRNIPILRIFEPPNNFITFKSKVEIEGNIYPENSKLAINNLEIEKSFNGNFKQEISLFSGRNIIIFNYGMEDFSNRKELLIFRKEKNSEKVLNIIAGQQNSIKVPAEEFNVLKIYTFQGKHVGDIKNISNAEWDGLINGNYLKTGIYIYVIKNIKGEVLRTGRLKYLNEK
ncbi:MAG: hypothetical protein FXF47_07980 [Candidatus Mcinerneyibacterium aminivorans]|uniref:Doublecortin domain-containing protein n=1 Tax=Candidatus Mcinerneyibacterium aminivorans TaxID=2703815 RepID=A0A5D0MFM7_9BACT|nr:MAG: hypothetical protein FXF47_07980 [Candidatus Mcinerneyibacterium aminivorans]